MGPPQETVTEKPVETLPVLQASPLQRVEAIRLLQEFESVSLSTALFREAQEGMPPMAATHRQLCSWPRLGRKSCVAVREERRHVLSDQESSTDRKTRRSSARPHYSRALPSAECGHCHG